MSETDFIRKQQFLDALKKKGLPMGQGQAFITQADLGTVGQVAKELFGTTPTVVTVQVDNGYMVVFSPAKAGFKRHPSSFALGRHLGAPYPGIRAQGFPGQGSIAPEDEQKLANEEAERRRQVAVQGLRMKVRVRVYPALSQAMDEIKKFYEAGGVVPGIDFEKMADDVVDDIGEGLELGA